MKNIIFTSPHCQLQPLCLFILFFLVIIVHCCYQVGRHNGNTPDFYSEMPTLYLIQVTGYYDMSFMISSYECEDNIIKQTMTVSFVVLTHHFWSSSHLIQHSMMS
jgi:hypothetical protein